jgi:kynurenine 3-monooxygenase
MGDAAHAMVPFYGQGMNSGFEDALYFDEVLDSCNSNLAKAVPEFSRTREAAGNAIAKLSMNNYMEMRHHTGSSLFLLRKKFEGVLNAMFPTWWIPLYKMVTFTRIPYHHVIEREQAQDRILSQFGTAATFAMAVGGAFVAKTFIQSAL